MDVDEESVASFYEQRTPSVYSFSSSRDGNALLRSIEGRTFNAQNDLYFLPADEGEFSRLDKQHLMLLMAVGGLYAAAERVQKVLAPELGVQKGILDLGTGGGNWAIGMAQEFPHAQVVGVDLAPSTTRPPPPNCRFEFDDFTLGLPHYYGTFDVVHARSTGNGVKDYEWFIGEAAKCLKPGGILLFVEGNFELQNSKKERQELAYGDGAPGQSWLARMLHEAYNTMKMRGSSMDAGGKLYPWMARCPLLTDVGAKVLWLPIGPWEQGSTPEESQQKEMIGMLMRRNSIEFVRALKPLFISEGFPLKMIDRCIEGTDKELTELSVHMYVRWHFAWATKVDSPPCTPALVDGPWLYPVTAGQDNDPRMNLCV